MVNKSGVVTMNHEESLSGCNICGGSHETQDCFYLQGCQHVPNTPMLSKARQTVPPDLEITKMADGTTSIITRRVLPRGTTFGPFEAKRNWMMNPMTYFPIRIFGSSPSETYHLDYSSEDTSNWMCFIAPASSATEQNLICYQLKSNIFYTAIREIIPGEELRVWYAPFYATKMQMPLYNVDIISSGFPVPAQDLQKFSSDGTTNHVETLNKEMALKLAERLPAQELGAKDDKTTWNCKICAVVVHSRHRARKHPESVTESFGISTSDDPRQENEQISSTNLHMLDTNSLTVNDLLQSNNLIETSPLKSILENQGCLSITLNPLTDSILADNLSSSDPPKFNVDDLTSELLSMTNHSDRLSHQINNLDCDICGKKFDKAEYLYRHLRKHTGEFICPGCLAVFARKENLLSHVCSSSTKRDGFECPYCQKQFAVKKYFKRHMIQHSGKIYCKWCRKTFLCQLELDSHQCPAPRHVCPDCGKRFSHRAHLLRHGKIHNGLKQVAKNIKDKKKGIDEKPFICEKCGDAFKTPSILKQHLRSHGERQFECDICQRRFHRLGVLKQHRFIHEHAQIPCHVCGKKLKSKKALDVHVLLHGNKKFHCEKCEKSFFQRCNYLKHFKQMHGDKVIHKCPHCPLQFTSKASYTKHVASHSKPAEYSCGLCQKNFHRQYQLNRHIQTSHSGIVYRCPYCQMTVRYQHSMRRHFQKQHKDLSDEWKRPGFVKGLEEKIDEGEDQKEKGNAGGCDQEVLPSVQIREWEEPGVQLPTEEDSKIEEVPQLHINNTDLQLAEMVLNNAYVLDEEAQNIMYYILDTGVNVDGY
ncbi:zinc finger protein 184-like isoform X2 [Diachasmimorpha longicaudata]|uniref:zinc finger protein 184-like isoform X2 n=1 Tax=Diachasmimorpha longicaudata TaxID=58733 RepID=UPI0030B8F2E7